MLVTINYDSDSNNSYVKFSNNEFTASYGGAEVYYGDQYYNSMPCSLTISGLYRVVSQEDYDKENNRLCSKIELLITEVSFQYDKKNTQVCNELNSFVGKTTNEKITFTEMYSDLSYLTEKQLKEYDLELHEPVTSRVDAMFGFREDGSYGLIYLDTPIIEQTTPLTFARMGAEGKDHLFADVMRMKTRSTVSINNKKVEPGLFFYDIIPHDKETITE